MAETVKESLFIEATQTAYIKFAMNNFIAMYTDRIVEAPIRFGDPVRTGITLKRISHEIPLLNVGDSFYFEDINQLVKIHEVIRTSNNSVAYVVVTKTILDHESHAKYEKDKAMYLDIKKLLGRNLWERIRNKDNR